MYKQVPFWVVSVTTLIFFITALWLVWLTRATLPARTSLHAPAGQHIPVKDISTVDLAIIAQNDLFQAPHQETQPTPEPEVVFQVPEMPAAPAPVSAKPVQPYRPEFIEPLAIALKGIMYSSDEWYNRVIIEDTSTKKEEMYKVGDIVLDGEIMNILPDRVNIIRLNGQIETVFITEKDAQESLESEKARDYNDIVTPEKNGVYTIYVDALSKKLHSMAQLLKELDITMAFNKGVAQGLRVGVLPEGGLGKALGLIPGDIVYDIAGMAPTSTEQRIAIYQALKDLPVGSQFSAKLIRQGQEVEMIYRYDRTMLPELVDAIAAAEKQHVSPEQVTNTLVAHAQQSQEPMDQKIQNQMKHAMSTHQSSLDTRVA